MSAVPARRGASKSGSSSGGWEKSPSIQVTRVPRARSMPSTIDSVRPAGGCRSITWVCEYADDAWRASAAVPSGERSSMTRISCGTPSSAAATRSISGAMLPASLKVGRTTLT